MTVVTNLVANSGFATNSTGWSDGGLFTISRSTDRAHSGPASGKCVADGTNAGADFAAAIYAVTCATSTQYTLSAWVYIPTSWTGGQITLEFRDLTAPAVRGQTNAVMATRDAWQLVTVTAFTGVNALCGLRCVADNIKLNEFFYIDDLQIELGAVANSYIDTDGAAVTAELYTGSGGGTAGGAALAVYALAVIGSGGGTTGGFAQVVFDSIWVIETLGSYRPTISSDGLAGRSTESTGSYNYVITSGNSP